MTKSFWLWRRLIPVDQAEAWFETLSWIDPQRVIVLSRPNAKRARLEVHGSRPAELRRLLATHGGKRHRLAKRDLLPADKNRQIRVHRQLYVAGDRKTAQSLKKKTPGLRTLLIPASMAFGSGEHATTGMVLRHLGRIPSKVSNVTALDLGTGSGILALAMRAMSAKSVQAMDNCPNCIRIARDNEAANFSTRAIRWQCAELDTFSPKARFELVTANLFSDLLIAQAARIWNCLTPDGLLLLSGILQPQAAGVIRAYRKVGGHLARQSRRGKWALLVFEKKRARV